MRWPGMVTSRTAESGDSSLGPKIPKRNAECDLAFTTMYQNLLGALETMLGETSGRPGTG